ncbi:TraX family protein [Paenibacillus sp. NPDC056722]|uniref:TraX family protein n=1 Tax=Paenibacillus sp. NPDC056722 TaxID=3345924 RepID=UPI0036B73AF8
MQILAMVTMLIDHIGAIFFPGEMTWRYIGRIAFPIYCYALVQGHIHTSSRSKYVLRLLFIALLAQIPYNLALNPGGWNVVFTLLLSVLVLVVLDKLPSPWLGVPVVAAAVLLMEYYPLDYNAYGLLLVLIFRYTRSHGLVLAHLALNIFYLFYYGWLIQMASLVPTLAIVYAPAIWTTLQRRRVPRWVWWSFYPVHLAVLALVRGLVNDHWMPIGWMQLLKL